MRSGSPVTAANMTGNAQPPWARWSIAKQAQYLARLFPLPGSRVMNVVSGECMIKSMLAAYGLVGEEWQTEGGSSHVDWARADDSGHPGSYAKAAIDFDAAGVRQVGTRVPSLHAHR